MEDIFQEMDKERDDRFKRVWSKLDKGSKSNRILLFIKLKKTELELNDSQEKQFKALLYQLCESGALNKTSEIDYCSETYQILNIKNLEYDEDNKKFNFKKVEKKKSVSKSKTNIEKHLNRSKTNKKSL
tara:strand:+ start:193 stop:579 length:387 start_codon:yes stop_codon:yes gene_type:complete